MLNPSVKQILLRAEQEVRKPAARAAEIDGKKEILIRKEAPHYIVGETSLGCFEMHSDNNRMHCSQHSYSRNYPLIMDR